MLRKPVPKRQKRRKFDLVFIESFTMGYACLALIVPAG
jgi:hypothetical protein